MTLKIDRILPIILGYYKNSRTFEEFILEIHELKTKIENCDEQSFYFRKGIVSHKKRLQDMLREFDYTKNLVNEKDFNYFYKKIKTEKSSRDKIIPNSFLKRMWCEAVDHSIKKYEYLVAIKKKYDYIEDLESMINKLF